jgi:enoyl-CoA hydratase/carnithine racemase
VSSGLNVSVAGHIVTVRLARPDKCNALTQAMWRELGLALDALPGSARVLVLVAEGEHFSVGTDLVEFNSHVKNRAWLRDNHELVQRSEHKLHAAPIPTIAVIRGRCIGSALGLVTACDFRLAAGNSVLGVAPAGLGLSYSLAATRRLSELVGPARTREMLFCGREISAQTALDWGLLHELASPGKLEIRASELAAELSAASRSALAAIKATLLAISEGQCHESEDTRQRALAAFDSPDFAEAGDALLAKRAPRYF